MISFTVEGLSEYAQKFFEFMRTGVITHEGITFRVSGKTTEPHLTYDRNLKSIGLMWLGSTVAVEHQLGTAYLTRLQFNHPEVSNFFETGRIELTKYRGFEINLVVDGPSVPIIKFNSDHTYVYWRDAKVNVEKIGKDPELKCIRIYKTKAVVELKLYPDIEIRFGAA